MKIAIGCDHIVTPIKEAVIKALEAKGHQLVDCGTKDLVRTHYPIYGLHVGQKVVTNAVDFGIVICGTGVGISNAANKVKGVRATLIRDVLSAKVAKANLNANVIAFGGRITGLGLILEAIQAFMQTKYIVNTENEANIALIDQQIPHSIHNSYLLDVEIKKWEEGFYTDGQPQTKLTCK